MPEFKVRLNEIDASVRRFEFSISKTWLETALEGTDVSPPAEPVAGTLTFDAYETGKDVIVAGRAKATLIVPCSRCLEDVVLPVQTELSLVMSEPPADWDPDSEEIEFAAEDLGREFFKGDEIVLDDIVRDHLLLELPMQPRCAPPGCPEWVKSYLTTEEADLAAKAEAKPAVDPRLAPLQGLKGKLDKPN